MMPYLPFILSRVGRLGAVIEGEYGAKKTPEFQALLDRMRFDFELTKAELTYERFIVTFADWCHEKGRCDPDAGVWQGPVPAGEQHAARLPRRRIVDDELPAP